MTLACLLTWSTVGVAAPAPWRVTFNTRPPGPSVRLLLKKNNPALRALGIETSSTIVSVALGKSPLEPARMQSIVVEDRALMADVFLRALASAGGEVEVALEVSGLAPVTLTVPAAAFGPGDHYLPDPGWTPSMTPAEREEALDAHAVRFSADIVRLVIDADPPGAEVYLDSLQGLSYLGTAGLPLSLDRGTLRAALAQRQPDVARLVLRAPMYLDTPEEITLGDLRANETNRRPVGRPAVLQPRYGPLSRLGTFAVRHPFLVGFAALLSAYGLARVLAWRRRVARDAADVAEYRRLAATADTSDPLVRDQVELDGYKIVDRIGSGGMATVYLAFATEWTRAGRWWAIKLMRPEISSDPEFRARFHREARHGRRLLHPSIVRTVHDGEYNGLLYMVMEFVEGKTLAEHVRARVLAPREALALLTPVFEAVAFAHDLGIVHRDLKPENVMIDDNGAIKIMDFGLARSEADLTKVTQTGAALGTPAYMPPEQLAAKGLDPRSDQYSLGIMTFELLTGQLPFDGDQPLVVAMMHLTEAPPTVRSVRPDLSPAIDPVVSRMLEKEPADRFASLSEALEALTGALG